MLPFLPKPLLLLHHDEARGEAALPPLFCRWPAGGAAVSLRDSRPPEFVWWGAGVSRALVKDGLSAQSWPLFPQSWASLAGSSQMSGLVLPHLVGVPSQGNKGKSTLEARCVVGYVAITEELSTSPQHEAPASSLSSPPTSGKSSCLS